MLDLLAQKFFRTSVMKVYLRELEIAVRAVILAKVE
jgi:hypothetical protein